MTTSPPFGVPQNADIKPTVTSAIEMFWLEGMADPDMAEWWGTQDAHETAAALAEAIVSAVDGHFTINARPFTGGGPL